MIKKQTSVFIDVGAHRGEALEEALRPIYGIDKFLIIEPSTQGFNKIKTFKDRRLEIFNFAVLDVETKMNLYAAGSVGGGIYQDKVRHWEYTESVMVKKFSDFVLKNTNPEDEIFIKINAEGSEYKILKDLLFVKDRKIKSILLSIDIDKVPSLKKYHSDFSKMVKSYPYAIKVRTHKDVGIAINSWLVELGLRRKLNLGKYLRDQFRVYLPLDRNVLRIIKPIIPRKLWIKFALKIGPNRFK